MWHDIDLRMCQREVDFSVYTQLKIRQEFSRIALVNQLWFKRLKRMKFERIKIMLDRQK